MLKRTISAVSSILLACAAIALMFTLTAVAMTLMGLAFGAAFMVAQSVAILMIPACIFWAFRPAFKRESGRLEAAGEIVFRIAASFLFCALAGDALELLDTREMLTLIGISVSILLTMVAVIKVHELWRTWRERASRQHVERAP